MKTCNFYLSEVVDGVCYHGSSENNPFVISNKGKVAYIRPLKTHAQWDFLDDIEIMKCCMEILAISTC